MYKLLQHIGMSNYKLCFLLALQRNGVYKRILRIVT